MTGAAACQGRWATATLPHARNHAKKLSVERAPKVYVPITCLICGFYHVERRRDLEKD